MVARRILKSALIVGLVVVCDLARARASDPEYTEVLALGCYLPIPVGYVLNTRERSHFTWFNSELLSSGRINIGALQERPPEKYELLNKRQLGPLTLLELRSKTKGVELPPNDPLREVTVIRNGVQEVTLYGDARVHAAHMFGTCAKRPAP